MTSIVAIDTGLLIWGIQRQVTDDRHRHLIGRTMSLFRRFEHEKRIVIVPAIVLAEFMVKIDTEQERIRYENIVKEKFIVAPFDVRTASYYHKIWNANCDKESRDRIAAEVGVPRKSLKADALIVATAVAAGAVEIYGHDGGLPHIANGFITFKHIEQVELQTRIEDHLPTNAA